MYQGGFSDSNVPWRLSNFSEVLQENLLAGERFQGKNPGYRQDVTVADMPTYGASRIAEQPLVWILIRSSVCHFQILLMLSYLM